jgi:hypothetical protein
MRRLPRTPAFLPRAGAELAPLQVHRRLAQGHDGLPATPVLASPLLRDRASRDYNPLTPFLVQRYHDPIPFIRILGRHRSGGAIPPPSVLPSLVELSGAWPALGCGGRWTR